MPSSIAPHIVEAAEKIISIGKMASNSTQQLAISDSTARVALAAPCLRVVFDATVDCRIAWGDATVTASLTTSKQIYAGSEYILDIDGSVTHIAAITSGATGTLDITPVRLEPAPWGV